MTTKKSINFTIVPAEPEGDDAGGRIYANFCAVSHTPFDFTLTFCEVHPLSEKDIAEVPEGGTKTIGAPVKSKVVIPLQLVGPELEPQVIACARRRSRDRYTSAASAPCASPAWPAGLIGGELPWRS